MHGCNFLQACMQIFARMDAIFCMHGCKSCKKVRQSLTSDFGAPFLYVFLYAKDLTYAHLNPMGFTAPRLSRSSCLQNSSISSKPAFLPERMYSMVRLRAMFSIWPPEKS